MNETAVGKSDCAAPPQDATSWGTASCTHTDAGLTATNMNGLPHGPAWWQVIAVPRCDGGAVMRWWL